MELIHRLLLQAIEGENCAETNYRQAMNKALAEKLPGIASLFKALTRAEAIHSANHIRALHKYGFTEPLPHFTMSASTGSTKDNLKRAVTDEAE